MNKKGQSLVNLIVFSGLIFVFVIMLGITLYFFSQINVALVDSNINANGLNYSNFSAETVGKVNTAFQNQSDLIGTLFIFGVVFSLFIAGYFNRNNNSILFFVVDFMILILAYIIAVYISNSYEMILTALPFNDLIITNLNNTSTLLLNLPLITLITGAITMVISYAGLPRTQEEDVGGL